MAYQALYRTWRPMVFDDVAGQEHITQTLRNEIKTGNLAHWTGFPVLFVII